MNSIRIGACATWQGFALAAVLLLFAGLSLPGPAAAQAGDPTAPAHPVKLIFIHHSSGENWLTDGHGNLGQALGQNNYFVSDTNYGWGPDGIGDRTDILNWPEWFASPETPRYLAALFAENDQHSGYTRGLADPGGENQIILFKSCFPNSALEGAPTDPPSPGDDLTVASAKAVYNSLLQTFMSHPDKLFVVITAPPLQDPSLAANARAFNTWLVQDWLQENKYPYSNVAVWDFYNVLTHPDNHHRFRDGQVEYVTTAGSDTLYYPDNGDDHPSPQGNQKATAEFVPMLNVFYHRWQASDAAAPPPVEDTPATEVSPPPEAGASGAPPLTSPGDLGLDDFDAGPPPGSEGWVAYSDEATPTNMACAPEGGLFYGGELALHLSFDVTAESWGTCALFFHSPQDWSSYRGLGFFLHGGGDTPDFDFTVYQQAGDDQQTFIATIETTPESTDGWASIEIPWDRFRRAEWEAQDVLTPNPAQIIGIAFAVGAGPEEPYIGELWMDDLHFLGSAPPVSTPAVAQDLVETMVVEAPANEPQAAPAAEAPARPRLCSGALVMGLMVAGAAYGRRRRI